MFKIVIKDQAGNDVNEFLINNPAIEQAAKIEVELHNRDNPEDQWAIEIQEVME